MHGRDTGTTTRSRRRSPGTALPVLAIVLALSGCAGDQLQVGRASDMVKAGRAATDGSRTVINGSFESHRRFVVDLAALDPTCELPTPRLMVGVNAWGGCVQGADSRGVPLSGPSQAYAKLSLASIAGMVAYLDAIDAVANRKPVDVAGGLEEARDDLATVVGAIDAVSGSVTKLPVTKDQLDAAKGLVDLLSGMIDAARRGRDLKTLESELDAGKFGTSLAKLREITTAWTSALVLSVEREGIEIDGIRALQAANLRRLCPDAQAVRCPYDRLTAADRLEARLLAERKLAVLDLTPRVGELKSRVSTLLTAFETAHRDYRQLLLDPANAKLTAAERSLRAKVIRGQILSALKSVIAIVALV